jgi:hypothetical protein
MVKHPLFRKIELVANVAVIALALVLGVILIKRYLLPNSQTKTLHHQPRLRWELNFRYQEWT